MALIICREFCWTLDYVMSLSPTQIADVGAFLELEQQKVKRRRRGN